MKRCIFPLLLVLTASQYTFAQRPLTHQTLFDTIPYIMDHHQNRLDLFAKEAMTQGGVLFLGNSITEGGPWSDFVEGTVVNRGIGGDITFGMLNRLDEVIERRPQKLFLLIGINDLSKDIPPAVVSDNVGKIIERIKQESPSTQVFLQSILPINTRIKGFPQHFGKEKAVLLCNQLLFQVADKTKVTFVNLYPYFLNQDLLMDESLSTDGVHLKPKGYELWVELLKKWGHL